MAKLTRITTLDKLDLSQVKLMRDRELAAFNKMSQVMEKLQEIVSKEYNFTLKEFLEIAEENKKNLEMYQEEYKKRQILATIAKF